MNLTPIQLSRPARPNQCRASRDQLALQQAIQSLTPEGVTVLPWPDDAEHHHDTAYRAARAVGARICLIKHPDHGRIIARTS